MAEINIGLENKDNLQHLNNNLNLELNNNKSFNINKREFILNHDNNKENKFYEFYINNNIKNKNEFNYKNNKITTAKYNFLTFLPKALFYQFKRVSTTYFLLIAIINMFPAISPIYSGTSLIPVLIVISISLIREAYEDY